MRQIRLLLTALLAWLAATAGAQLRVTEHLLIGGGMANNYITDIEEDGRGRIWVATESGLNCYNGFEFQSYNTANSGLNSNMINALYYDAEGDRLWIGTKGSGLSMMDIGSRRITTIGGQNPQANNIMHIAAAADGGLWIVSQTSILRCIGGDSLQTVCTDTGQGFLQCLLDYGDGTLVIGHYLGGISLLDTRTGKTRRPLTADSQLYRETVSDIVKDHQGRTWLATGKGLWYYTPETDRLERFEPMAIGSITDIELIDGGEIWASSTGGVWTADLSKWTARRIPNLRSQGSPTHNVRKIHQDRFGNVWFGSMGNGIDFFSHETPQFARLSERSIWGIYKDYDGVWAGTTDRLMCFRDSMLVREIIVGSPDREGSFVISINSDDEGHLMVSHFGHLLQIDKQSGRISEIRHDDGRPVFSLTFYKDRDGTLWITTREGICTYRHGRLTREEKLNSSLQRQSVNGIRRDRQGKLWVATYENGIYLFDQQQRLLQHLDRQGGFLSNSIQHLHTDPKGGIWLSTPDGMGYIADTSCPEHYEAYGYEQGLRDSYIRAIQEDQEGKVWVSTNNGISLLRQEDKTFVNFNKYDGIPTNNFTGGAVERDGKMYFTSLDGLCYFDPRSLTDRRLLSDIHILDRIDLGNNSFRIVFGLSDYAQSRQTDYQYRLKGKDDDWTDLEESAITFRNLSPGRYTIAIRARLKGQPWEAGKQTETEIYIAPPLWQRWWAYLIYIVVLALLGWGYFSRYKHRLKLQSALELERQKNLDEQQRNTERLQFFTNITHELRTPLTLILGPLEELKDDKTLPAKVKERIGIIHRSSEQLKNLITQLLEFRKTETHNRQLIVMRQDLRQTVEKVGQGFSELNTNTHLRYIITVGDTPQELYYDENVVTTILNNLMSNAAKYTPQGEIELSLTGDERQAVITVRDTGYGIAADALPHIFDRYYQAKGKHQASGTGIGLALVRSLATLHEADVRVESREGEGARFTLTLQKGNTYPNALHKENEELRMKNEESADGTAAEPSDERPLVLVVEDNTEIRRYIASELADDYQVIRASDGKAGLDKAFDRIPDLIITDIMMPVMDGNELCRRLKQDIRTSHIPIVMLTAKDTQADQQEGYESGADSYLTKPFSISMLRARITNLLEARQRMIEKMRNEKLVMSNYDYTQGGMDAQGGTGSSENSASKTNHNYSLLITNYSLDSFSQLDRQFLTDITAYIEANIAEQNLTMAMVGESVHMSHSTLYRKIKALTGLSGNEFIRKVRLRHSLHLMLHEHRNVSEAAYESGFSSLPYFRSCFKEEYGMTPTEYLKTMK